MRYKGGVISATPPTTSTSAATGVWTLVQQMQAQGAGAWPIAINGAPFWIGLLTGTNSIANSVAVDSSGNVYLCGQRGSFDMQIAKYNSSGVIQWQRQFGGGLVNGTQSITVDSSGNIYVCGYADPGALGNVDFIIAKYNTSGTIQWQRSLGGANNQYGYSVAVDSSSNIYVCGYNTNTFTFNIAKYNTSGAIQWQKSLGNSDRNYGYSVAVDTSSNVYVCGYTENTGTFVTGFQIAKYDTSGTIQWQRRLDTTGISRGYSIAVDSSSNVYVCGSAYLSGSHNFQIAKYDTSGAIQWQKGLSSSAADYAYSVAVDSSGNVYVCGVSSASGSQDLQIAKYNTSGTIQWQRKLDSNGSNDIGYSVAIDSSSNVYVCGNSLASGTNSFLFAKLPGSGALTGTYTVGGYSFIYAASTLTDASTSLTDAATSLASSTSTLTDAATSLTDAASTLTSSVTTL